MSIFSKKNKDKTITYPLSQASIQQLHQEVIAALKTVYDPEIPLNIYDLGLIYKVEIDENGFVFIRMTLTSMSCPFAHTLPGIVEKAATQVEGVVEAQVELVWDPPWTMSEAVRLQLGLI